MDSDPTFTGERFLPSCSGEIAYEHWHRYAFARQFASGRLVLDAACGEGYGSALIGAVAERVVGVDIDAQTVVHATTRYGASERIWFVEGSCAQLPLQDASFDVIVSFETIEHLAAPDQPRMLAEFARVLKRDGILVISSPNKHLYSDARDYVNEFHLHELYRADFAELIGNVLPAQRWYHQRVTSWSGIWPEDVVDGGAIEAWLGEANGVMPYVSPEGMYFLVVAARDETALLAHAAHASLLTDVDESEAKRSDRNAREALRLDALLHERDVALDRQSGHVKHLESLIAERERIVEDMSRRLTELNTVREQRDAQLHESSAKTTSLEGRVGVLDKQVLALDRRGGELNARIADLDAEGFRLEAALAAQERIIAYRQTARWWFRLPLLRLKLWLERLR